MTTKYYTCRYCPSDWVLMKGLKNKYVYMVTMPAITFSISNGLNIQRFLGEERGGGGGAEEGKKGTQGGKDREGRKLCLQIQYSNQTQGIIRVMNVHWVPVWSG